jgi:hypothetical protein
MVEATANASCRVAVKSRGSVQMTQLRHMQACLDAAEQRVRQLEEQLAAAQEQILLLVATKERPGSNGRRDASAEHYLTNNAPL